MYSITTIDLSEIRMLATYDEQAARAEAWERHAGEQAAQIEALQAELASAQGSLAELQSIVESGEDVGESLQAELASMRAQLEEANTAHAEAQAAAEEQAAAAEELTGQVGKLETEIAVLNARLEGEQADGDEADERAAAAAAARDELQEKLAAAMAAAANSEARATAAEAALAEQASSIAELEAAVEAGAGGGEEDGAAVAALKEEVMSLRAKVNAVGAHATVDGIKADHYVQLEIPCNPRRVFVCAEYLFLVAHEGDIWRRALDGCDWEHMGESPAPFLAFVSDSVVGWAVDEEGAVYYCPNVDMPQLEWQQVEMPEEVGPVVNLGIQPYPDAPKRVYAVTMGEENNAWMNSVDGASGWAQMTTPGPVSGVTSNGKKVWFTCTSGWVHVAPFSGSAESQSPGEPDNISDAHAIAADRTSKIILNQASCIWRTGVSGGGFQQLTGDGKQDITIYDGFYYQISGDGSVHSRGYYGRAERITAGHAADGPHGSIQSRKPNLYLDRADADIVSAVPRGYLRLFLQMAARSVSTGMLLRLQSTAFGGSLRCEDEEGQVVTARGGGGGLTQIQVRPHPRNPLAVILENRGNNRPQEAFQENAEHAGLAVGGSATPPSQFVPVWQSVGGSGTGLALRAHSGKFVQFSSSHGVDMAGAISERTAVTMHVHKNNAM